MNDFTMKHAVTGLLAALALVGPNTAIADPTPFSRIVVFGDSLSDTGNLYMLTGGYPPAPYANGRFSNGPLWVEYLAENLETPLSREDNYAVGGATTGDENANDGLFGLIYPGLQDQIEAYLAKLPASGGDPDALYVVWIGANDFFAALANGVEPAEMIATGVGNTVQAIQRLWLSGARHIPVVNIPDLGITPFGLESGNGESITQLSAAYNQVLKAALQSLAEAGMDIIRVDAFAALRAMVTFPQNYAFTNVTQPFFRTGGDPSEFLFWDDVHPTTRGHEVLADEAQRSLIEHYSHGTSEVIPPARINSLNGLVTAAERHATRH